MPRRRSFGPRAALGALGGILALPLAAAPLAQVAVVGAAAAALVEGSAARAEAAEDMSPGTDPPADVGLHWIDVGQGSALLAVGGGAAILVDGGPSSGAEAVIQALDRHRVRRVDLWLVTHYDADHIGAVSRIIAGADGRWGTGDDLQVDRFWDRGLDAMPDTDAAAIYRALAGESRVSAVVGDREVIGALGLEVVHVGDGVSENERGVAARLEVSGITLLIPGDLPASAVAEAAQRAGPVDVLWASHHGSFDGLSQEVVALADPWGVVISAGMDNPYCHPAPRVLAWLHDRSVWMTGAAGLGPGDRCPGIAEFMGPDHALLAGDLWMSFQP
ncbi:MAG: MBL fold metallo-hydrolase [Nannocystaceae bacterium]